MPSNKYVPSMIKALGPGTYEQKGLVGINAQMFTLKSRVKPADSPTRDNLPPNTYHLNFILSEAHKFSAIAFEFGNKCNVTGQIKETPGPGSYKIQINALPAKQHQSLKENGGLTPKLEHHRSKSNAERNDFDILDHNNEL